MLCFDFSFQASNLRICYCEALPKRRRRSPSLERRLALSAGISLLDSARKRKLLNKQSALNSIKSLSRKEFEELVGEAYRRKGYSVVENHGVGSDGGVDLRLNKDGNLFLVQCKHWKTQKLDVRVVREMYGVMTAERAFGAIIITSGLFTQDARNFAEDKPIDLVEGYQLADLIMSVQKPSPRAQNLEQSKPSKMTCQKCGSSLVIRVARRGKHQAGNSGAVPIFPSVRLLKNTRRDRFNSQWPSIPTTSNSKIKDDPVRQLSFPPTTLPYESAL